MEKWICTNCGYIYDPEIGDPENGAPAKTPFEDVPKDWVCPVCYVGKDLFDPL
ncbi:MAG: rubredoxin [Spirochaetales bacterium]|nr:rubredoxin [Spirochaetales bacterium]